MQSSFACLAMETKWLEPEYCALRGIQGTEVKTSRTPATRERINSLPRYVSEMSYSYSELPSSPEEVEKEKVQIPHRLPSVPQPFSCCRWILKLIVVLFLIYMACSYLSFNRFADLPSTESITINDTVIDYTKKPKILVWTSFYSENLKEMIDRNQAVCPLKCDYRSRENLRESEADAVFFHLRNIRMDPPDLPQHRRPDQYYTAFILESGYHTENTISGKNRLPDDFFNVTMDYRVGPKTYFWGYERMKKAETNEEKKKLEVLTEKEIDQIIAKKNSLSVAMISHCGTMSAREKYIEELTRHMPITFVGSCFRRHAHVHCRHSEDCERKLLESNYFVFAFENSICKDYVTEKFFRLRQNIVPLVLKRSLYDQIAPSSSFVAADDFKSPKEFSDYLKKVASNSTEYRRFFDWRKEYYFSNPAPGLCDFCRDLYHKNVTTHANFNREEYYRKDQCELHFAKQLLSKS